MWLDEIEEHLLRSRERNKLMVEEGVISHELGEIYTERMARVLRELGEIAKAAKHASEDWIPLQKYVDALSDDARELIKCQ